MAKLVKKTYGKKVAWETGSSHAFDEAKLHSSKSNPSKLIRPSIWAKVPLIETFTTETPPRPKKRTTMQVQDTPEVVNVSDVPKKGKKRKFEDPFGFEEVDDEVLPALEYISPKKTKEVKSKKSKNGDKSDLMSRIDSGGSPRKRGRPPKNKISSPSVSSPSVSSKDQGVTNDQKLNGHIGSQSPMKRGRPPKSSLKSPLSPSVSKIITKQTISDQVTPSQAQKRRGRPPKGKSPSPTKSFTATSAKLNLVGSNNSPSPKKRGRPPKNQVSSPSSPIKAALQFIEEKNSIRNTPSPKKRGRPPKNQVSSPSSPIKADLQFIEEKNSIRNTPSPKKRGRPPKSPSIITSDTTIERKGLSADRNLREAVTTPKKRGRPPKHESPYKAAVLPNHSQSTSVQSDGTPTNQSPRKRGRPPKISPLKSPSLVASDPSTSQSPAVKEKHNGGIAISSPKKRGRQPKSAGSQALSLSNSLESQPTSQDLKLRETPMSQSPRKRGRPPKNRDTKSSESSSAIESQSSLSAVGSDEENAVPVPKKRGRKPKSTSLKIEEETSSVEKNESKSETNGLVPGEGINVQQSDEVKDASVSSEDVIQVINEAPLVKRKRGRPSKKKLEDANSDTASSQEMINSDSVNELHASSLSKESNDSVEKNESKTPGTDPEESVASCEEREKKVRFSTDIVQADDDSELISSRASTSSASGSPFKWFLKNNEKTLSPKRVAQLRRMSVLPTCTPQKDDDDDENGSGELEGLPFSLSWAMQQDDNAVRVKKDDKELFTIVRNTKQAQESVEFGESQQFKDDIEYLLDGISDSTNSLSTRCLSLIELASKCSKSAFRMNLRAHGTITAIFEKLVDAAENQNLALCTASVMFMLTRDRLSVDFDKSILEMMLKLLAMTDSTDDNPSKEWERLTSKIRTIFEKNEIKGVNNLDLSNLTTESLARESLLSLTLQKTGSWLKDEIRLLGGLDHVVDTVVSCSKCLKVTGKADSDSDSDSSTNVRQIERCFKLLENVTVQCPTNQGYLISYRDSALLETCSRLLKFSVASLIDGSCENKSAVQALWFSTMKILLNLTHDNELASTRFCQKNNVLSILLKSALQLPGYLPSAKQFDIIVLSLGLLINLVEYSKKNLMALNAALAPALQSATQDENMSFSETDEASAVESLMYLFLDKLEAAKDNSGMEEDLAKLNSSLHNSSIRIGSDGLSVICGDDLDKTENEESATVKDKESEEKDVAEKSEEKTAAEKEAEHIGKALQKAGQHMEDSLIASYAALLLGLLCEDNKENQKVIHEKLQYGDFGIMTHTLDKFLAFMNMTASSSSSSSSLVIKRAIGILEQCKSEYPANILLTQAEQ